MALLTDDASYQALPLFNVTRTFVSQLELFRACDYHPSADHPLVQSWASTGSPAALLGAAAAASGDLGHGMPRLKKSHNNHWRAESDAEGEDERDLRRKIGTPARCGSFSVPSSAAGTRPALPISAASSTYAKMSQAGGAGARAGMGPSGGGGGGHLQHISPQPLQVVTVGSPGLPLGVNPKGLLERIHA